MSSILRCTYVPRVLVVTSVGEAIGELTLALKLALELRSLAALVLVARWVPLLGGWLRGSTSLLDLVLLVAPLQLDVCGLVLVVVDYVDDPAYDLLRYVEASCPTFRVVGRCDVSQLGGKSAYLEREKLVKAGFPLKPIAEDYEVFTISNYSEQILLHYQPILWWLPVGTVIRGFHLLARSSA